MSTGNAQNQASIDLFNSKWDVPRGDWNLGNRVKKGHFQSPRSGIIYM